jgi:ABC-type Fe3+-hydroxamate transport system substrate-binding protein
MFRVRDDMWRELVFVGPPRRIVSLVPSDTYSLFALGLGDRVVGRTRYCVEPAPAVDRVAVCGGTKDTDVDAVCELAPDLVLANQEENARPDLEALALRNMPVFVSFPRRVGDGLAHLARIARMCGVAGEPAVKQLLGAGYDVVRRADSERSASAVPTFVPIWMEPLMTMNADTFGSDMVSLAGGSNVFDERIRLYPLKADIGQRAPLPPDAVKGRDTRYPRITLDEVVARAPELVLLPDEPHAFTEADAAVFRDLPIPAARHGRVVLCDGKDVFWYGARSIEGLARLRDLVRGNIG